MKINYRLSSILCIIGLVIAACSETPEQQAKREAQEECQTFIKTMVPPHVKPAELQKHIDRCTADITQEKLAHLSRLARQAELGEPKDVAYYLANVAARQEVLSDCAPFGDNIYSHKDCNNAELAKEQATIYALTNGQDSQPYFFENENNRKKVLLMCNSFLHNKPDIIPCLNAYNAEKETHIQRLLEKTKGLEKVEDFLNNKQVIQDLFRECRDNKYIKDTQKCHTLLEADQIWVLSELKEKAKGGESIEYFRENRNIMREVNTFCVLNSSYYDFLKDNPICQNSSEANRY